MDEMIDKVVASHFLHSPYAKDKVKNLEEAKPILHLFDTRGFTILCTTYSSCDKFVIWSHLSSLLAPLVKPLILFSSSIPTFFYLSWDDRLLCLKLRFFEIWVVHASRLVNSDHGTITFSNGCYLSRTQLEIMYDEEFVTQLFNFAGCLKDLQLTDNAIALYLAVVLYSTDGRETKLLREIQEKYKIYLSYQLHVRDARPEVYEILLSVLPELQDIGRAHLQHAKRMSVDVSPQADEPLLLAEVFDSIKEDDIKSLLNGD